jgi:hypothetical protein
VPGADSEISKAITTRYLKATKKKNKWNKRKET